MLAFLSRCLFLSLFIFSSNVAFAINFPSANHSDLLSLCESLSIIPEEDSAPVFHLPEKTYQYQICIAAITNNEAQYLKEWIEFHRLVGVEHFYLFNHLSTDNYLEVLQPYLDQQIVELIDWPYPLKDIFDWNTIQCNAYMHAIHLSKGKAKWVAFIDTDEFLFPTQDINLLEFLSQYEQYAAVTANWQVYGTSNIPKIPSDRLLIETLVMKSPALDKINLHVKSIVRPECIANCLCPHYFIFTSGYYQVTPEHIRFKGPFSPCVQTCNLRINHYTARDEEFLKNVKLPRVMKWGFPTECFETAYKELNQVFDPAIVRYADELRKTMGLLPEDVQINE